jgi:hypothetical protein
VPEVTRARGPRILGCIIPGANPLPDPTAAP